jgi:hypothetical protein
MDVGSGGISWEAGWIREGSHERHGYVATKASFSRGSLYLAVFLEGFSFEMITHRLFVLIFRAHVGGYITSMRWRLLGHCQGCIKNGFRI